jgi:hypothetical protein
MSKGSRRRPCLISLAEEDLRWKLAFGRISESEFQSAMVRLCREGKLRKERRKR